MELAHCVVSLLAGVDERAVAYLEFLGLLVLIGVSLGNAYARDRAFERGVDNCVACAALGERGTHLLSEISGNDNEYRHADEDYKRQQPIERAKVNEGGNEGRRADKQVFGTVVSKLADLKEVGGHTGHDLTRLVLVIEGERKTLDLREKVAAHLRLHSDTDQVTVILHEIAQEKSDNVKCEHDHACRDDKLCGISDFKEVVNELAGDDGLDHTDERDNERGEHIERQHPCVRFVISNKAF